MRGYLIKFTSRAPNERSKPLLYPRKHRTIYRRLHTMHSFAADARLDPLRAAFTKRSGILIGHTLRKHCVLVIESFVRRK